MSGLPGASRRVVSRVCPRTSQNALTASLRRYEQGVRPPRRSEGAGPREAAEMAACGVILIEERDGEQPGG